MAAKTKSKDLKTVKVSGIVRQEGKLYSAWCPELDVASQGDTVEEAHSNLGDAVELYLNTLVGLGEIDRVLAKEGRRATPRTDARQMCTSQAGT